MKYAMFLTMILFTVIAAAQLKPVASSDSLAQNAVLKNTVRNQIRKQKNVGLITVKAEIENELNKLVSIYYDQPNTHATWVKIKAAAENLLYGYFKSGKLSGSKNTEAYYVKIGNETMTATDIINRRIILVAGIATVKPAEFEMIRIEKTVAK